jgi:hypothetical protein
MSLKLNFNDVEYVFMYNWIDYVTCIFGNKWKKKGENIAKKKDKISRLRISKEEWYLNLKSKLN